MKNASTSIRKIRTVFFLLLFLPFLKLYAQQTEISGLYRYTLDNGLELFVMENDSAPLAYIEIAVRAGAVTQTPENAGLFHLYEHIMFKGNAKYADQKEVMDALNKMGVSNWNGTTSIDRVNYFFTVPSSLVRDGLEFWSYAIRTPLMDNQELENEKSVVLSEIEGGMSEPGRIFGAGVFKCLFPESPWRLDTSGDPSIIKSATVEQLRKIQAEYYVPQNTALFVGGAVEHENVYSLVKDIYGDWQNGPDARGGNNIVSVPSKTPLSRTKKLVFPDPRSSGAISQLVLYLRGPDAETDAEDTYCADVWAYLLENPEGSFIRNAVQDRQLNIPDADYIGGGYSTMRASGIISFSAAFVNGGGLSPDERAEKILDYWTGQAVDDMLGSGTGYDDKDIQSVDKKLEDSRQYSMETASGFLSAFSSEWATSGADYALGYDGNIKKVRRSDVSAFVEKYIKGKNGVAVLFVSPGYYAEHKNELMDSGWEELNADNARWWR